MTIPHIPSEVLNTKNVHILNGVGREDKKYLLILPFLHPGPWLANMAPPSRPLPRNFESPPYLILQSIYHCIVGEPKYSS